jgi:hypothetical protein
MTATMATPEVSIRAYPMLSEAAPMLRIDATTLGRWANGRAIENGGRAKRLPPTVVMKAAAHFKNVVLNDVAHSLIAYATQHSPEGVSHVTEMVEAAFRPRDDNVFQFLGEARRLLPDGLFEAVRVAVEGHAAADGAPIEGDDSDD